SPWNELSDAVAGAMLLRSVVVVGVCAKATLASNADAATPAVIYFVNMCFLPNINWVKKNPAATAAVPDRRREFQRLSNAIYFGLRGTCRVSARAGFRCAAQFSRLQSEPAPIGRYSVIAMQLRFLRAIAPVEILVGAERRRAPEFVIVDVELVGFELRVIGEARPGERQQVGSHAEEPAEAEDRVGHLAADLVDHQPFDVADPVAVRPSHRGAFDPVARDQLVRFCHDNGHHHPPFGLMRQTNVLAFKEFRQAASASEPSSSKNATASNW